MNNQNTTLKLRDGKSVLHTWTQDFAKTPTVGETVSIDTSANPDLSGYKDEAKVMLIEANHDGSHTIILEAVPRVGPGERPILVMNRDYVPERHRSEAEAFLRKHFDVPAFEWVDSDLPQPIVNVHAHPMPPITELRKITDELRVLLLKDSPVALAN